MRRAAAALHGGRPRPRACFTLLYTTVAGYAHSRKDDGAKSPSEKSRRSRSPEEGHLPSHLRSLALPAPGRALVGGASLHRGGRGRESRDWSGGVRLFSNNVLLRAPQLYCFCERTFVFVLDRGSIGLFLHCGLHGGVRGGVRGGVPHATCRICS